MPTITINKDVFEKLVGKKLPIDKLKDRISYLGTDLESIEGNEIIVEVFPDRPDMLSEQGFARAFSSFIDVKTGLRKYDVEKSGEKVIIDKSVNKVRPCTTCAIVKGLKLDDEKIKEIIQLQEKLHITFCRNRKKAAIGIYPSEEIIYPIRYMAKSPKDIKFQPLEMNKELTALQILSQHPAGKEHGKLLEGKDKFPIFIDANNNILSMPPIINSHRTGRVNEKTTDVFIECSGFDIEAQNELLNIIVTALADMGGRIYSMQLEYPDKKITTPSLEPRKMKLNLNYINNRLGLDLKEKEAKVLLEKMGYAYEKGNVLIPSYRADVLHQVDIAEDIAIAYGYDNLLPEIPRVATIGNESKMSSFQNKIARMLTGLKFIETKNFTITNKKWQTSHMNTKVDVVELSNALNQDYDVMRSWLTPELLSTLSRNKHNEYPQDIFEMGKTLKKGKSETGVVEDEKLAVAVCNDKADFTSIKQVLDYIFNSMEIKYKIEELKHDSFIEGRCGKILFKGKDIGHIGEIHPKVLENWDLKYPVAVFEINLTNLFNLFIL